MIGAGPWKAGGFVVTRDEVFDVYASIRDFPDPRTSRNICAVFGTYGLSDPRCDKALQLLRRDGMIRYDGASGWVRVKDERSIREISDAAKKPSYPRQPVEIVDDADGD